MIQLLKPYTEQQRIDFVFTYGHKQNKAIAYGLKAIYALEVYEQLDTSTGEDIIKDLREDPAYILEQLNTAKIAKYAEIEQARAYKIEGSGSTITINMPAVLRKGTEVKQVTSYKLLVSTTSGPLDTVLTTLKDAPAALLTDVLVDADGYTIVGLSQEVEYQGQKATQVYMIWLMYFMQKIAVTEYVRQLNDAILAAETIEAVDAITYDFSQF